MATSMELQTELILEHCPTCFVAYGLPKALRDRALERRAAHNIYCPNGHSWSYSGKSKDQEIDDLKWQLQQKDNHLADVVAAKSRLAAAKLKLEQRIDKGVCPYCRRSFANVAQHMHAKHVKEKV